MIVELTLGGRGGVRAPGFEKLPIWDKIQPLTRLPVFVCSNTCFSVCGPRFDAMKNESGKAHSCCRALESFGCGLSDFPVEFPDSKWDVGGLKYTIMIRRPEQFKKLVKAENKEKTYKNKQLKNIYN